MLQITLVTHPEDRTNVETGIGGSVHYSGEFFGSPAEEVNKIIGRALHEAAEAAEASDKRVIDIRLTMVPDGAVHWFLRTSQD